MVAQILAVVEAPDLDPLTIGVHEWREVDSPRLLEGPSGMGPYVVVPTAPWEYDDHTGVRGTPIARVMGELETRFSCSVSLDGSGRCPP